MGAMSIGKSKTVVSLLKIINIVDRYWEDNGSPTTFMDHIIPSLVKVALYVCICPWKGSLHLKRYLTFFKRNYMMKQGFQEVALFHTNEMWVQYKSSRKRWLWKRILQAIYLYTIMCCSCNSFTFIHASKNMYIQIDSPLTGSPDR